MTIDHIAELNTCNPRAVALFVKRAQIQLGAAAEGSDCPFFLAGRIARDFVQGDAAAAGLLFRSANGAGTARERRETGGQL